MSQSKSSSATFLNRLPAPVSAALVMSLPFLFLAVAIFLVDQGGSVAAWAILGIIGLLVLGNLVYKYATLYAPRGRNREFVSWLAHAEGASFFRLVGLFLPLGLVSQLVFGRPFAPGLVANNGAIINADLLILLVAIVLVWNRAIAPRIPEPSVQPTPTPDQANPAA